MPTLLCLGRWVLHIMGDLACSSPKPTIANQGRRSITVLIVAVSWSAADLLTINFTPFNKFSISTRLDEKTMSGILIKSRMYTTWGSFACSLNRIFKNLLTLDRTSTDLQLSALTYHSMSSYSIEQVIHSL